MENLGTWDRLVRLAKQDHREREEHEESRERQEREESSDFKVRQEQLVTTEILVNPDRPVFLVQLVHLEIL